MDQVDEGKCIENKSKVDTIVISNERITERSVPRLQVDPRFGFCIAKQDGPRYGSHARDCAPAPHQGLHCARVRSPLA